MRLEFRDADDSVLSAVEFDADENAKGELTATGFYGTSTYQFGARDTTLVIRVNGVKNVKSAAKSAKEDA